MEESHSGDLRTEKGKGGHCVLETPSWQFPLRDKRRQTSFMRLFKS